jgi:acetyl-CoA carboxylase biotin carboxyl carrier protein
MDLRKVKKLIELVEESGIVELEVKSGDEAIRIAMPGAATGTTIPAVVRSVAPAASTPAATTSSHSLAAPMAGTFYRAPSPEAESFVEVGDQIHAGEVLCIIESMKMLHEIAALEDGTVAEICIPNGEPISTGEVLFKFS